MMMIRHSARSMLATATMGLWMFMGPSFVGQPASAAESKPLRIVAFGDSLIAGYGLSLNDAFPKQLEAALAEHEPDVEIVNAGVSGDTTAAARARLDWAFPPDADAAIVLLGGNDFLRGLSPTKMRENLDAILTTLRARKLPVLLMGMKAARNTGKAYYTSFDAVYPDLARKHGTLLEPFFLQEVAGKRTLNQIDGIHPNAAGVAKIVAQVMPRVEALVVRARKARGS